jgi:hypothetical protein
MDKSLEIDRMRKEMEIARMRKAMQQTTQPVEPADEGTSLADYGKGLLETGEAALRGAIPASLGMVGDVAELIKATRNPVAMSGYLTGATADQNPFTTKNIKKITDPILDAIIGEPSYDQISKEDVEVVSGIGELIAPTVGVGAFGKIAKAPLRDLPANEMKAMLRDDVAKFSSELADIKLSDTGRVVADVTGAKLVSLDVPRPLVSVVTNANPATKRAMGEMLDIIETGSKNQIATMADRATDVVGESLAKRLSFLRGKRKALGEQLDDVVKNELSNIQVDMSSVRSTLTKEIANKFDLDVVLNRKGGLDLDGLEKLPVKTRNQVRQINDILTAQTDNATITGRQAHSLKKILDDFIDEGVSGADMSSKVKQSVSETRKFINSQLQTASQRYGDINANLAKIINAEEPFKKFSKYRKWDADNLKSVMGATVRNLSNDAPSNASLAQSIDMLDDVVKSFGLRLKDEPKAMILFNKDMKNFMSFTPENMAKYSGGKFAKGMADLGASSAVGNTFGAVHDMKRLTELGVGKRQAIKLMKQNKEALQLMKKELSK